MQARRGCQHSGEKEPTIPATTLARASSARVDRPLDCCVIDALSLISRSEDSADTNERFASDNQSDQTSGTLKTIRASGHQGPQGRRVRRWIPYSRILLLLRSLLG